MRPTGFIRPPVLFPACLWTESCNQLSCFGKRPWPLLGPWMGSQFFKHLTWRPLAVMALAIQPPSCRLRLTATNAKSQLDQYGPQGLQLLRPLLGLALLPLQILDALDFRHGDPPVTSPMDGMDAFLRVVVANPVIDLLLGEFEASCRLSQREFV